MNRRKFLQFLGIGVPAAAVVAVMAPKAEKVIAAKLGEWSSYYSEGEFETLNAIENWKTEQHATVTLDKNSRIYFDREMLDNLKRENHDLYMSALSRNIHVGSPVPREFFTYNIGKM